jgi:uroporphyrinogen decarboxylase
VAEFMPLTTKPISQKSEDQPFLVRALKRERLPRPPIWLMRQAGRTDPAYNALRAHDPRPLEALFADADTAAEVSLLPRRIGVDAIIYFQDILTPLAPMGCPFVFRPGPVTDTPIRDAADVDRLHPYDVADELPFIAQTFRNVRRALDGELPVLGFAGAPVTLAVFMIEGKSFGDSADRALAFFREQPAATRRLLDLLTDVTIDYLRYQVESGAFAVQLFESAAYLLTPDLYRQFALPTHQRIFHALRGRAPTIMFAREWGDIADLDASGADILSLPASVTIAQARAIAGPDRVVQGNLSNRLLCAGPLDAIERETREIVESGGRKGHIFNLDHGLLRETPFDHVEYLVRLVRSL